jgi:hypothetical protein
MSTAEGANDRLYKLYFRAMARLSAIAEQVETAMGLELMAEPPKVAVEKSPEEDAEE